MVAPAYHGPIKSLHHASTFTTQGAPLEQGISYCIYQCLENIKRQLLSFVGSAEAFDFVNYTIRESRETL